MKVFFHANSINLTNPTSKQQMYACSNQIQDEFYDRKLTFRYRYLICSCFLYDFNYFCQDLKKRFKIKDQPN